jgi:hypothetical protein
MPSVAAEAAPTAQIRRGFSTRRFVTTPQLAQHIWPEQYVSDTVTAERRQITVLYGRLEVISQALASFDPETLYGLWQAFYATCNALLEEVDGLMVQLIAVMPFCSILAIPGA